MNTICRLAATLALVLAAATCRAAIRPDILIADFEGKDYGEWKVEGEAFGPGPARGTLPGQMPVAGYLGKGLVNSYYKGDGSTGRLASPPLRIERRYVNFLIGGGMHPGKASINLLVDGSVVRTATGPNDRPGGSEHLDWHTWDVSDLAGKTVVIEIVDQATGGWGHVNVDHVIQSDQKKDAVLRDQRREMVIEKRYLNLPVTTGAAKRRVSVVVDGEPAREFEIELADAEPEFWTFLDATPLRGKKVTLVVDRLTEGSQGLRAIHQADTLAGAENLYKEAKRPQFHFSSRRGWNNDPNGLLYHKGEYHLFYQYNPYGWNWGNMHWGHAVSTDLLHWQELPVAIYPHRFGDWVFSGSAVVDKDNTAGFKKGDEDVIVAAYTSTGRGEAIAYSNDRGRTFTDYPGNPVVKHQGRDPKVIWYAPGKHWVMALFDELDSKGGIAFYTSPDLKNWERQSWIEGYFECPEIFEMPVDGDANRRKWVLYAADGNYAIGAFNGRQFTAESGKHQFHHGNCFYASQTFNNIPHADGRRIQIAWGQASTPGMPFNQCMLFPCELSLRTTDEGVRMAAEPIQELARLRGKRHAFPAQEIQPGDNPLSGVVGELLEIQAEFAVPEVTGEAKHQFGLRIRGLPFSYDVGKQTLSCGGKAAALKPADGKVRLQVLVDRTTVEVFANGGRVYMPMRASVNDDDKSLAVFTDGGKTRVNLLEVYELKSIWNP